ncbi:MAG: nuclear transport factor 2 family protein [bacterium]
MSQHTEIAERFFTASAAGDPSAMTALCDPAVQVRQNSGATMGVTALTGLARAVKRAAPDFRYENALRSDTGTGFVEEHDVCGTLADGSTFRMAVCVVATVADGKITSMHEYLDTAEAAPLMAAMARPRA